VFNSLLFNYFCLLGTSLVYLSLLVGVFSLVVVSACNKWYQSIQVHHGDRVSIPRALVAVLRRSCVDLGAALGLFVGLCVDLRTVFELLKESNLVG